MAHDLQALFGSVIPETDLALPKAAAVVRYARHPDVQYGQVVECRRGASGQEIVILDLRIEVPQRPVAPIESTERIGVIFSRADNHYPDVLCLRESFPDVPHLNLRPATEPKSICLYLEPYHDLKLHWTAHRFVERIRYWLAKTADGTLHPADQPLEPLMSIGHGTLVVPDDLLISSSRVAIEPRYVSAVDGARRGSIWIMHPPGSKLNTEKHPSHTATSFSCEPQTHGVITAAPGDLATLHELLHRCGFDVVGELQKRLAEWKGSQRFNEIRATQLFLIFSLPKRRTERGPPESVDYVAFLCACTIESLDRQLENFSATHEYKGPIQIPASVQEAANIKILPFHVTREFSTDFAAALNNTQFDTRNFCLLGVGAVGSQLFDSLLRSGFGKWTIIDDDFLLPHNLARHHLSGSFVGRKKAHSMAFIANDVFSQGAATAIVANVLQPGENETPVREALEAAAAVCDCTASVPVARALARDVLQCRRVISLFLNPEANALVMLAEDEKRMCRIDWLEMQYYREVAGNHALAGHLRSPSPLRYANACRSVTVRISAEAVALFASIASRAFREAVSRSESSISIWQLDDGMQVSRLNVLSEPVITQTVGRWTLCLDSQLLHKVHAFRLLRLPNETGGVLLGTYDMDRAIVYIVDMLPSPVDSEEWPTSYRRGCVGLAQAVQEIEHKTQSNLEYIGEWHSHPDGCATGMSEVDKVAMREIAGEMSKTGLPGLILIVGAEGSYSPHLTEADEVSQQSRLTLSS